MMARVWPILLLGVAEGLKMPAYRRCVLTRAAVVVDPPKDEVENVETRRRTKSKGTGASSVQERPSTKRRPSTRKKLPPIDFEKFLDLVLPERVPTAFFVGVQIVCTLLAFAGIAPWIMVGLGAANLALNATLGIRDIRRERREEPEEKLKKKLEPFSDVPSIYGPEDLGQDVESYYFDDASKTNFLVLTNATPEQSSGTAEVFRKLRSNEMFSGQKVFFVSMNKESLEDQLKQDLGNDATLTKVGELAKAESAAVIILVASIFTEDVVERVFLDTAALKRGGGNAVDIIVCVPKADQLPKTLPAVARVDKATREARSTEERALEEAKRARTTDDLNVAAAKGPKPFFFAVLTQAPDRGLSDDKLNYLAVVEELLIENDARAIEEAGEIRDTYLSSSRDDSAVLAALGAFARFGFARK